jgi:hypothetical protein
LNVFKEGIRSDSANVVNYSGAVVAMSLLAKPAAERVKTLESYPDLDHMPTTLVYELALNRAEEGNYGGAVDLFRNRFFGSEEGGTNVRQVWVEVKLQQAFGLARTGHCEEALATGRALGSPVAGLSFTQSGLEPFLNSARANYLLGETSSACSQKEEADQRYRLSAKATDASDTVWAWGAAKNLSDYDPGLWGQRLSSALSQAESNARTSANEGWWVYSVGLLQMALGRDSEGKNSLWESMLLPENRMSHHFSRLALEGATPR